MDEENVQNPDELENQQIAVNAVPLCPNCLEPCDSRDNYCPNCDSNEAINPLASYFPYENIRFQTGMFGKLWHKSRDSNTALWLKIFCAGLYILLVPLMFLMFASCARYQYLFKRKRFSGRDKK